MDVGDVIAGISGAAAIGSLAVAFTSNRAARDAASIAQAALYDARTPRFTVFVEEVEYERTDYLHVRLDSARKLDGYTLTILRREGLRLVPRSTKPNCALAVSDIGGEVPGPVRVGDERIWHVAVDEHGWTGSTRIRLTCLVGDEEWDVAYVVSFPRPDRYEPSRIPSP
ncbi:hypothetical protein [Cryptosporangium arvum]|uniref:hypothetical protein n=1 Tax=Cryptosporangium arvum TaxID=80871 RepID=UPI0012EEE003|nr:hypothetical protein [Cryptosporangium arvum]